MNAHATPRSGKRVATLIAVFGMLLMSSGFAVMGGAGTARAADSTCTPRAAYTEMVDHPARTHTERVMTDPGSPAVQEVAAVPGFWTNFEPTEKHEPYVGPPTYPTDPDGTWSASKVQGGPDQDKSGVYQNGQGNGSWFYRSQGTPAIPGKPAVPPTYEDQVVVDEEAWTETIDHPAVTCEVEAKVTVDPPTCENSGVGSWSLTGEHLTFAPAASGTGGPGSVVVDATAADGYLFDNGTSTKTYTVELPTYTAPDGFEIDESGACVAVAGPQTVTPGPVTFAEDCDPFAVTLPGGTVVTEPGTSEIAGVEYAVTGDLAAGGTVTVEATPTDELVLEEGAQTEWTHTFATEEQCTLVEPPVVDPPTVDPPTGEATITTGAPGTTTGTTTGGTTGQGTTVPEAVHAGLGSVGPTAPTGHGLALALSGLLLVLAGGAGMVRNHGV